MAFFSRWPSMTISGHGYGTVVIDSVDWLLRRMEEHVSGVKDSEHGMAQIMNRSHGGYGNGKQVLKNYVYQYLLPTLDRIVNSGVAVVLLAHATRHEVTSIDHRRTGRAVHRGVRRAGSHAEPGVPDAEDRLAAPGEGRGRPVGAGAAAGGGAGEHRIRHFQLGLGQTVALLPVPAGGQRVGTREHGRLLEEP